MGIDLLNSLRVHEIDLPKKVLVGRKVIEMLPSVLNELRLEGHVLIVSGPNVYRRYGSYLEESLASSSRVKSFEVIYAKNSSKEYAEEVVNTVNHRRADIIIGFGGGKSIDLAKYAAFALDRVFISIPTSASHDGISSPFASLRGLSRPFSIKTKTPIAIIADTAIIVQAPPRLLRAGAGDLVAKLTAVRDWKLAHKLKNEYYGDYAAKLALLSAKHVLEYASLIRKGGEEAVRIVVEGLISSGIAMCIAGSTRPASGSEHLFSHALDIITGGKALHGEQVALGTIMMMYLHGGNWRRVRQAVKKMGLPVRANDLGITDEEVIEALTMAHKIRPERYTILGETGLTKEAAENLAKTTGVIED